MAHLKDNLKLYDLHEVGCFAILSPLLQFTFCTLEPQTLRLKHYNRVGKVFH